MLRVDVTQTILGTGKQERQFRLGPGQCASYNVGARLEIPPAPMTARVGVCEHSRRSQGLMSLRTASRANQRAACGACLGQSGD